MKLRLISDHSRTFDLPQDIGQILLLIPNSPVEEVPRPPVKRGVGMWRIGETIHSGRVVLAVSCATCGNASTDGSEKAHEKRFYHCGKSEECPPDVAKQWREVYKRLDRFTGRLIRKPESDENDPVLKAFRTSRVHCQY